MWVAMKMKDRVAVIVSSTPKPSNCVISGCSRMEDAPSTRTLHGVQAEDIGSFHDRLQSHDPNVHGVYSTQPEDDDVLIQKSVWTGTRQLSEDEDDADYAWVLELDRTSFRVASPETQRRICVLGFEAF